MTEGPPAEGGRAPDWLEIPPGWSVMETRGRYGFVTHVVLRGPDGLTTELSSRGQRKRSGSVRRAAARSRARTGPRASAMSLLIGALFMAGSTCFALGSLPVYFENVTPDLVGATFFVGSIFFTCAGYLQFRESGGPPADLEARTPPRRGLRALIGWRPRRIGWWATIIQLVGTVFFNVTTFAATRSDLSLDQEKQLIWAPDVYGSICFLVASWLAYSEVVPRLRSRPRPTVEWRIAALNLAGSVAFGAAAVASRYLPTTGEPANIALVNLGTFVGAVCFFIGAALLPVESRRATGTAPTSA